MNRYFPQFLISLFLGCSILLWGCGKENPASGDNTHASSIAGKVLPKTIAAKIIVEQGRPVDSAANSTADGYFLLSDLKPGTYRLCIAAAGYDTFSAFITVEPDFAYEFGTILLAPKTENFSDTIPSIYDHYPSDNAEVIYLPPDKYSQGSNRLYISVSFDRPMNRASVENALSISPPVSGGYFEWFQNTRKFSYQDPTTTYLWNGQSLYDSISMEAKGAMDLVPASLPSATISTYSVAKSFTFYFPRSQCFTDTTYTISISRQALDTAGTPLDTALKFSFKTVQSALSYQGVQMIPHSGDDWVSLINRGISLTFPKRMDQASTEAGIKVNLHSDPIFLWTDYNHLTIYTGGIFVPDTTYIITIDAAVKDLDNVPVGKADTLRFGTAPIGVSQSDPMRGEIGFPPGNSMVITFNTYMDQTSFPSRCTLVSKAGDTVWGSWAYISYATYNPTRAAYDSTYYLDRIRFTPAYSLSRNMFYTLTIGAGVKDLNGYVMKESYQIPFITAP
jgi:hypothetical protein